MQHYLVLSRGNFYAEKQHSNKVLPFGARGPVIVSHRVVLITVMFCSEDSVFVAKTLSLH